MMIEREMKMKANQETDISKRRLWAARMMGGIAVVFMLMDGIGKLVGPAPVVEATLGLGFTERHMAIMGVSGLLSTLLYVIPRTSLLGALLLTGYWGGAIAAQLRVDAPLFSNVLFPLYIAVFCWGALWLGDERLRKLLA